MTGPLGNSEFCFPRISMFPSTSSRETLRFSGNKIHCSLRDQLLSVYLYQYSNMAPRLSSQTSIFGVVFFVSNSLLGIEGQNKLEKFAFLTRTPRSHA